MPPIPQFAKVLAKRAKAKPKVTKTVTVAKKATKTVAKKETKAEEKPAKKTATKKTAKAE